MSQVRIAVAGCGLIGREHISRIIASERAVLAATVDPTAEAANYATEIGSVHFSDLDAYSRLRSPMLSFLLPPTICTQRKRLS